MRNVYRRGAKDVHRAIVSGGVRYDHAPCMLDGTGGAWTPGIPPGPRCPVCFRGAVAESTNRRRRAALAGSAGVLALVALVVAGQPDGDPVSTFGVPGLTASFDFHVSPTATVETTAAPTAATPSVTPEPSLALPTETPALTPTPRPDPTATTAPTATPDRPAPTSPPLPSPTCFHPGHNYGVSECRWPHN